MDTKVFSYNCAYITETIYDELINKLPGLEAFTDFFFWFNSRKNVDLPIKTLIIDYFAEKNNEILFRLSDFLISEKTKRLYLGDPAKVKDIVNFFQKTGFDMLFKISQKNIEFSDTISEGWPFPEQEKILNELEKLGFDSESFRIKSMFEKNYSLKKDLYFKEELHNWILEIIQFDDKTIFKVMEEIQQNIIDKLENSEFLYK